MSESALDPNATDDEVLRPREIPIAETAQFYGLVAKEEDVCESPNVIDTFNPSAKHTLGSKT